MGSLAHLLIQKVKVPALFGRSAQSANQLNPPIRQSANQLNPPIR
jgi:hypothetical protein